MKKFLITLFFLIVFSNTVCAYLIKGVGGISCGEFLTEEDSEVKSLVDRSWLTGYISGLNRQNSLNKGEGVDSQSILLAVKNRCREKPLKDVEDATNWVYWNEL